MHLRSQRSKKTVASPLDVFVWAGSPGSTKSHGFLLAGKLVLNESGAADLSKLVASFSYDKDYIEAPGAYALDPINLPLMSGEFSTDNAYLTLGAIFDAAPDAWGRRVIQANEKTNAVDGGTYERAFLRGADGIGALLLKPSLAGTTQQDLIELVNWSRRERPTLNQLNDAAIASRQLETAQEMDEAQLSLLAGSWTIGGARPKAIVRNEGPLQLSEPLPGSSLIAKFPSANESIDRAAIEWACLRMARDMGFNVPGHAFADVQTGRALVIERFDRFELDESKSALKEGRRHYVSANSLVSSLSESKRLDTSHDRTVFSFGNLMSVASRVSARPKDARFEMFSRLLLNTMLHNTDDHLKNFGFVQMSEVGHFELAPVFDVSPQGLTEHFLHLNNRDGRRYSCADVLDNARALGISARAAVQARDRILDVLEVRDIYYDQAGVPEHQREAIDRLIHLGTDDILQAHADPSSYPAPKGL
jgi:serine/threonine-protein kinase HipA